MKKVLAMMLAVCALSMSTVVYAQEQCTATKPVAQKEMSERRGAILKKELNLSDEQVMQIKAIDAEFEASKQASREDMKAMRAKRKAAIENVLTPEQKVKFDEMQKKHMAKRELRRQDGKKLRDGVCAEKDGCRKPHMKCDSLRGKHHRGHMHKCQNGEMQCDKKADCKRDCQKACDKMKDCKKDCDKKADCKKDCQKGDCQKACDKMKDCKKDCDKKADCKKDCQKGDCQKACDKMKDCKKDCDKKKECSKK